MFGDDDYDDRDGPGFMVGSSVDWWSESGQWVRHVEDDQEFRER